VSLFATRGVRRLLVIGGRAVSRLNAATFRSFGDLVTHKSNDFLRAFCASAFMPFQGRGALAPEVNDLAGRHNAIQGRGDLPELAIGRAILWAIARVFYDEMVGKARAPQLYLIAAAARQRVVDSLLTLGFHVFQISEEGFHPGVDFVGVVVDGLEPHF
jgi:hypothetical protein